MNRLLARQKARPQRIRLPTAIVFPHNEQRHERQANTGTTHCVGLRNLLVKSCEATDLHQSVEKIDSGLRKKSVKQYSINELGYL
jgi:hypothetical protein